MVRASSKGENVKIFNNLNEFAAALGSQLGPTEWMEIGLSLIHI